MFEDVPGSISLLGADFQPIAECQDCRYNWSPGHTEHGQCPSVELLTRHNFDLYGYAGSPARYVVIYRNTAEEREVLFMWNIGSASDTGTVAVGPLGASLE